MLTLSQSTWSSGKVSFWNYILSGL